MTSIKDNCLKLKSEVGMAVQKSKQTSRTSRDNQHIIHSTSLRLLFRCNYVSTPAYNNNNIAISVNKSNSITHSDLMRKASIGMYYNMHVLIIPTTLVCLLFSIAFPASLFNLKQYY